MEWFIVLAESVFWVCLVMVLFTIVHIMVYGRTDAETKPAKYWQDDYVSVGLCASAIAIGFYLGGQPIWIGTLVALGAAVICVGHLVFGYTGQRDAEGQPLPVVRSLSKFLKRLLSSISAREVNGSATRSEYGNLECKSLAELRELRKSNRYLIDGEYKQKVEKLLQVKDLE